MIKMVYNSASSVNGLHPSSGVQKPKLRRKYVPHHMRSEESALKRNARERRRQGRINDALDRLNLHLPQTGPEDRKAGKEGIIRRAIKYIDTLSSILGKTSRKLPLFPVQGNPVAIPEPSPEFQALPEELFGQLMIEAQHWISSTQVTPLMTSSPNNVRMQATDPLHGEYIICDPYTTQMPNVHCQNSDQESGYFDCSYADIYSPSSSSGSSAADDIVDELFTSDSFNSETSYEHLESTMDFDTFVWWRHAMVIISIAILMRKWPMLIAFNCFESYIYIYTFHQSVCAYIAWMHIFMIFIIVYISIEYHPVQLSSKIIYDIMFLILVKQSTFSSIKYLFQNISWFLLFDGMAITSPTIVQTVHMMTSSNGNIFRVTGPLCGEFTGPLTKASEAELWHFLWYTPDKRLNNLRRRRAHYDVTVMNMVNGHDYTNFHWKWSRRLPKDTVRWTNQNW